LKSGCLLALLADIARYKHLYSEKESFRKVKLAKVRQAQKHTQTNRQNGRFIVYVIEGRK
jgi:hypothetical protein